MTICYNCRYPVIGTECEMCGCTNVGSYYDIENKYLVNAKSKPMYSPYKRCKICLRRLLRLDPPSLTTSDWIKLVVLCIIDKHAKHNNCINCGIDIDDVRLWFKVIKKGTKYNPFVTYIQYELENYHKLPHDYELHLDEWEIDYIARYFHAIYNYTQHKSPHYGFYIRKILELMPGNEDTKNRYNNVRKCIRVQSKNIEDINEKIWKSIQTYIDCQ